MKKKQSSVDWFHNELEHEGNTHGFISKKMLDIHFNRAKAMHKDEIEETYREGRSDQQSKETFYNRNSEQYYNETFGGNNE